MPKWHSSQPEVGRRCRSLSQTEIWDQHPRINILWQVFQRTSAKVQCFCVLNLHFKDTDKNKFQNPICVILLNLLFIRATKVFLCCALNLHLKDKRHIHKLKRTYLVPNLWPFLRQRGQKLFLERPAHRVIPRINKFWSQQHQTLVLGRGY